MEILMKNLGVNRATSQFNEIFNSLSYDKTDPFIMHVPITRIGLNTYFNVHSDEIQ